MCKIERLAEAKGVSRQLLPRPDHGHQPRGGQIDETNSRNVDSLDPHSSWLKEWRSLRASSGGGDVEASRAEVRQLQEKIAHTPAETLAGLQAQAELISELAWNDLVAAAARRLLAGIKRLQRSEPR